MAADERQAFLAQLLEIITDHPGIEVVSIEPVLEASQDERPNTREISSGWDVPVA
jgi:hypothetical protein